jgi:1-acyl-sn-glycerol-3-phosphate acyltransferase
VFGYLFISNHQSMYDVPIFGGILIRNFPKYVAKRSLARGIPSISLNLRRGGNALIDRGERAQALTAIAQMAAECQDRSVSAVIFPEGTRSRDGSLASYRVGGVAALMEGAPELEIIPTVIDGSWRVFLNNMFPVPFGTHVRVAFGEPIPRDSNEDPEVVLEQCREWAVETLSRWHEGSGPVA